ncbi:glycosyltransferase family 1 protein [soil metagenome]
MNLGIDISQIVYKGTGVARFTEGLVEAILTYDTENSWTFVFFGLRMKPDAELIKKIESKHQFISTPIPPKALSFLHNTVHTFASHLTFSTIFPRSFDWFITSDWTEPTLPCRKATIVHDLVFKRYPETVHADILKNQEARLKWISKETSLIFTDSKITAEDLKQFYHIPEQKIVVNYPGVSDHILQANDLYTVAKLRERFKISDKYILTVGKLEPRKNIGRLLEAFSAIQTDAKLIIVGADGWGDLPQSQDPRVIFPGYVSEEELTMLYQQATAFVYPSLYEGFGYPIVEAMKYGTPVATSNTSSLAEISTDAALLFDPLDTNSIRSAIEQLLTNDNLRADLVARGKTQATLFTWKRYYDTLIASLTQNNVYTSP